MNQDQIINLIQTFGKVLGGAAAAHGAANAATNGASLGPVVEAATGLLVALASWYFSHKGNATPPTEPPPSSPKIGLWFLIGCLSLGLGAASLTGCHTTPAGKALAVENGTHVTVEAAMAAWGAYVAQFHPPVEQERVVNAAWKKYQAAMIVAIDATKVFGTLTETNGPPAAPDAQSKMSAAMAEAAADLADLLALVRQFGAKI